MTTYYNINCYIKIQLYSFSPGYYKPFVVLLCPCMLVYVFDFLLINLLNNVSTLYDILWLVYFVNDFCFTVYYNNVFCVSWITNIWTVAVYESKYKYKWYFLLLVSLLLLSLWLLKCTYETCKNALLSLTSQ